MLLYILNRFSEEEKYDTSTLSLVLLSVLLGYVCRHVEQSICSVHIVVQNTVALHVVVVGGERWDGKMCPYGKIDSLILLPK